MFSRMPIYPPECLDRAIAEFRNLCGVKKQSVGSGVTEITLSVLDGAPDGTPEEFMNFLLSASLEKLLT
jgi:hypothetical protein